MTTLKHKSKLFWLQNNSILLTEILALLGFFDATYLTILHYTDTIPPCSITHGCEHVLASTFASVGPIPLALLGAVFYLTILFTTVLFSQTQKKQYLFGLLALSQSGFVVALVLFLIQATILHTYCMYCLLSEGISVGIFIGSLLVLRKKD